MFYAEVKGESLIQFKAEISTIKSTQAQFCRCLGISCLVESSQRKLRLHSVLLCEAPLGVVIPKWQVEACCAIFFLRILIFALECLSPDQIISSLPS